MPRTKTVDVYPLEDLQIDMSEGLAKRVAETLRWAERDTFFAEVKANAKKLKITPEQYYAMHLFTKMLDARFEQSATKRELGADRYFDLLVKTGYTAEQAKEIIAGRLRVESNTGKLVEV